MQLGLAKLVKIFSKNINFMLRKIRDKFHQLIKELAQLINRAFDLYASLFCSRSIMASEINRPRAVYSRKYGNQHFRAIGKKQV